MAPNNAILFNGVLIPKLLSNPFSCCSLINFDFLLPDIAHSDKIIVLPWLFLKLWDLCFQYFFYTLNNMITLFLYNTDIFMCLFKSFSLFKSFMLFALLILPLICS